MLLSSAPLIIGHRGAPTVAPENTMLSFQKAWEIGVDMIELDLQNTKDGQLVVIHDYELSRLTSTEGFVGDSDYSELYKLDVGGGERIPLLTDVLAWSKGKVKLNIEIKVPDIEHDALKLVDDRGMLDSVLFSSFIPSVVEKLKNINVDARTALLLNEIDKSSIATAKELKADAINPLFFTIPENFTRQVHSAELKIFPWTVNEKDIMMNLVKQGVDGIITDFPGVGVLLKKELDMSR
ncbi:glycerophosphodiester phosphodiesterase [Candidatus Thorarchaeota archaeon]|nr:MAG: glycerophosphodiester phosphodiesterase [Candidatus Thorarchaeota archaeon]